MKYVVRDSDGDLISSFDRRKDAKQARKNYTSQTREQAFITKEEEPILRRR